jgi:predicted transposase YbfD/YdcC
MPRPTLTALPAHFASLPDPRVVGRTAYPLVNILFIAVTAVICGVDTYTGMAVFAKAKRVWLAQYLDLSSGLPSHDTFNDVLSQLNPEEFERCLLSWITALVTVSHGQILAIAGKTVRGSSDRATNKAAIHMVSVWATQNHLSLGQVAVDAKSNEITAIPKLLELVEISGGLGTIDALGCQKKIAGKIREQGADYVLAVKQNQGRLYDDVSSVFVAAMEEDFVGWEHDIYMSEERGHGRFERRTYYTLPVQEWVRDAACWPDLTSLGLAIRERNTGTHESLESHFYMASRPLQAPEFAAAVRDHWGIENRLHWQLDVTFGEDASRIRKQHGARNFSTLRRTALSLLKQETTCKTGIAIKRQNAGWDDDYREKVLQGATV